MPGNPCKLPSIFLRAFYPALAGISMILRSLRARHPLTVRKALNRGWVTGPANPEPGKLGCRPTVLAAPIREQIVWRQRWQPTMPLIRILGLSVRHSLFQSHQLIQISVFGIGSISTTILPVGWKSKWWERALGSEFLQLTGAPAAEFGRVHRSI